MLNYNRAGVKRFKTVEEEKPDYVKYVLYTLAIIIILLILIFL